MYDAPTPTRTNLTILNGTTASLRGITGDAGPLLKTEYAGDRQEWERSLAAGIPSINTGISVRNTPSLHRSRVLPCLLRPSSSPYPGVPRPLGSQPLRAKPLWLW